MARSQAQKVRMKQVREGRLDPAVKRSPFAAHDLRSRRTKTKQEKAQQQKHRNHVLHDGYDGSFFVPGHVRSSYYFHAGELVR